MRKKTIDVEFACSKKQSKQKIHADADANANANKIAHRSQQ
jgi:hypothetical protein